MEVADDVRERLRSLGVASVWVFGSQVSGRTHRGSDTDVAVLLQKRTAPPSLLDLGRLSDVLAQALGAPDIDLVVLDEAPLELRAAVVCDGRLVARVDEPRRVAFEVLTLSRWFDVREAVRIQDRAYLARVAREGLG